MRRLAVITALIGATTLVAAAPAPAQDLTLTPSSAEFPPTRLHTESAPIRFTLTNVSGLFTDGASGIGLDTSAQRSFKQTNTCPEFIGPMESCFIDVVFAPDLPTPVHKTGTLGAGGQSGATAKLSGDVKSSGGNKKGCKKKGKKHSAAAAKKKKCKKKK